jgi:cytidylate kinase
MENRIQSGSPFFMIVAIDGPAGAGKSTVARGVAERCGFAYIDSGAMYRALALAAQEAEYSPERDQDKIIALAATLPLRFEDNGRRIFIAGREVSTVIRAPHMGEATSRIAAIGKVRPAIVEQQRRLGRAGEAQSGGVVLEGRDIQTVVFPDAEIKIFLTATPSTRAARRVRDWHAQDEQPDLSQLEKEIAERDERDSTREDSPLVAARDATILPTDYLTIEEVIDHITQIVEDYAIAAATP